MFFNSDFWPLFWGILGAGFAVTAMVSPRHHEEAEERVLVGGRK